MKLQPSTCAHVDMCGRPFVGTVSARKVRREAQGTRAEYVQQKIQEPHDIGGGEVIAIANDIAGEPFMIGEVIPINRVSGSSNPEEEECSYLIERHFQTEFGPYEPGDWVVDFQKYEPVAPGSSYYIRTTKLFPVYAEVIVARKVHLEPSTRRVTRDTRFHLEKGEVERIMSAVDEMPDWYEAPDMSGQD